MISLSCPNLKTVEGAYCFSFDRSCVRSFVHLFFRPFIRQTFRQDSELMKGVYLVLNFHTWVLSGNLAD